MAEIKLYISDYTLVSTIKKVLSCSVNQKLTTEQTLSFELPLEGDMENIHDDYSYIAEFEGEFYDVVRVKRSFTDGMYHISFVCEHISYRLTDFKIAYFARSGTAREILSMLLSGTGFLAGDVPQTQPETFSIPSTSTVRATVFDIAAQFGFEVKFHGYHVSFYEHIGKKEQVPLVERNVVSISKTVDCARNNKSFSCVLRSPEGFSLGDEVGLEFARLGIYEDVRITGFSRQPFSSKNVSVSVDADTPRLEHDAALLAEDMVSQNKAYYGVRLNAQEGLSITRQDEKARVTLNANEFRMQAADEEGELRDKLYFDPVTGDYKFVGTVKIEGGEIHIGDNFRVDTEGNAYLAGDATIYGGRYYAGKPGDGEGFSQMTAGGFEVYNADSAIKLRFGYTSEGEDFPFIQLGSGTGVGTDYGLVKKFSDGLWIGNSEPSDESGDFAARSGYNGIFFRFSDNTAYIVNGTTMKNIYTGAAIAKFG